MTTNGKAGAGINLRLRHGVGFTPEKCGLCEAKAPPHPAGLTIEGPFGKDYLVLCAKCDVSLTKLAAIAGAGQAITLTVAGPGEEEGGQTDMFGDLAEAAASADEDDDDGDDAESRPVVAGLLEVPVDHETGEVFRR